MLWILLGLLSMSPGVADANQSDPSCELGTRWRTVDRFDVDPESLSNAQASGLAATSKAVLAIGTANGKWVVRRSLDHGATWRTVETITFARSSIGFAIAGDKFGNVYAVGRLFYADGTESWLVRKSEDHGTTWSTVDEIVSDAGARFLEPRAVTIAKGGTVYVAGSITRPVTGGSRSRWITRRSTDGGASWAIVDEFPTELVNAQATAVVTAPDGRVFVSGRTGFEWKIRFSPDGTSWSTVANFGDQTDSAGGATDRKGRVIFVGTEARNDPGGPSTHWIVKRGDFDSPTDWRNVDDFLGNAVFASPQAATFSKSGDVFVTGLDFVKRFDQNYLTRRAKSLHHGFRPSDRIPLREELDDHLVQGNAAVTDSKGNVYTAGTIAPFSGEQEWIVRKLGCRGGAQQD